MGGGVRSLIRLAVESRKLLLDERKGSALVPTGERKMVVDELEDGPSRSRAEAMGHKDLAASRSTSSAREHEERRREPVQSEIGADTKEDGRQHDNVPVTEREPANEHGAEEPQASPRAHVTGRQGMEAFSTTSMESPLPQSKMEADSSSKGVHRGESELSILGLSMVRGRDSQLFNHETSQNLEFQLNSFRDMLMKVNYFSLRQQEGV